MPSVRSITEEVPPKEWDGLFAVLTRRHKAQCVTIERAVPDAGYRVAARNQALVNMAAGTGDEEHAVLISLVKAKPTDSRACFIDSPARRVWLKYNEEGADEALEIEGVDGTVTLLYFASAN